MSDDKNYDENTENQNIYEANDNEDLVLVEINEIENNDSNKYEELDEIELSKKFDEESFLSIDEKTVDDTKVQISEDEEKRIFISSLYLSGKPVEINTFRKMFEQINLENRLISYSEDFNKLNLGIKIRMVSGGYQIVTDSDISPFLENFFGEKAETLSKATLETVAIIAYKQPITKAEVEELREVNSSGTMRNLLDKNLIKVVGRKQVPGKPLLYATTKYFLEYFGLNDLSELPTFREWQDLKQNQ